MNGTEIETIKSSIKECDSHISKIIRARELLKDCFPLSERIFSNLGEEKIEHMDQLIYRFTKLQDSMGLRLLPSLYEYIEKDYTPKPFLSILKRLEQLEIIPGADVWQFFRNLRNNLAHDYPESIRQTVETLNTLYENIHKFENMYIQVKNYWQKAG